MNKQRRKATEKIADEIARLSSELEELRDDEQYYLEEMPENMQDGERAQASQEAVDYYDEVIDSLAEVATSLEYIYIPNL